MNAYETGSNEFESLGHFTPHGISWAETGIVSPFIYLPCDIATGTALGTANLPVYSNISGCPATFDAVDADSNADNVQGFWNGDPATDADYVFPGTTAMDTAGNGVFDLFNIFRGATNGVGGGILLLAFHLRGLNGASGGGGIISMGGDGAHYWDIGTSSDANGRLQMNIYDAAATPVVSAQSLLTNGTIVYDTTTIHRVAFLLDFKNGEILARVDNADITVPAKATILAAADDYGNPNLGPTFFNLGGGSTKGSRTVLYGSVDGAVRSFLAMDLTNYTGDAQADFPTMASELYTAPVYNIPRYFSGK